MRDDSAEARSALRTAPARYEADERLPGLARRARRAVDSLRGTLPDDEYEQLARAVSRLSTLNAIALSQSRTVTRHELERSGDELATLKAWSDAV